MTIFDTDEGDELRALLAGDYSDRVHAHFGGDFLNADGERVGLLRARTYLGSHADQIVLSESRNDPPEVAARELADALGFQYDGELHRAIVSLQVEQPPATVAAKATVGGTLTNATPADAEPQEESTPPEPELEAADAEPQAELEPEAEADDDEPAPPSAETN